MKTEEHKVSGRNLLDRVKQIIHEGNVRRITIKDSQGKSLIEIFSSARGTSAHGWFSARMAGLPFIGTVAGCAGKIVGMASPSDLPGEFDWARVLRHEFVHVVSLQQTDFNIPHWYTEALAVLQEDLPRPAAWR